MTQPLTSDDGLSTLVLTNLPPAQRKLIRLILRQVEPRYEDLCRIVAAWPEGEQMSQAELDVALKTLQEQHYLVELGDEPGQRYKVSFSRRASRELTQGLWENVGTAPLTPPATSSASPPPTDEQPNP